MDANKVKWYGILSTFVAGSLQMLMCYALFTYLFWEEFTSRELREWFEMFSHFSDFFIPILFLVCLRWSTKIGERIIIKREDAYKTSLHHLNWILSLAYTFSAIATFITPVITNGFDNSGFDKGWSGLLTIIVVILMTGLVLVRLLNYLPSFLGAIPLSRFLKRYQ